MRNASLYFILIFVGVVILTSCKHQSSNNKTNTEDTLLTKTIVFPENLLKLEGAEFLDIDSFISEVENKTKIFSIIDGNCPKCIVKLLNRTDSLFNDIIIDDEIVMIFILNVSKKDSAFFMRNLQPEINAVGNLLWDNNYNFERLNKLFTPDMNLRTFMVNSENKIIQYGNPVMHPNVIYEYQEKLEVNIAE